MKDPFHLTWLSPQQLVFALQGHMGTLTYKKSIDGQVKYFVF